MTTDRTTYRITQTYDLKIDAGEIPDAIIIKLIEEQASKYAPSLNLGDGDYFAGDGADFGSAEMVESSVEVRS